MLQEGDCVLVKGSNAMKMGHVVEYLRESDVGI
jgi:UDP-N-acetylmuramyl pentapeptide synthase